MGKIDVAIANICILSRRTGNYGNPDTAGPLILWAINSMEPVIPRSYPDLRSFFVSVYFYLIFLLNLLRELSPPSEGPRERESFLSTSNVFVCVCVCPCRRIVKKESYLK